jgi:DNA-binding MarR family transcriptional regulator
MDTPVKTPKARRPERITPARVASPRKRSAVPLQGVTQNVVYWARQLEILYDRQFMTAMRPVRTTISIWRILLWLHDNECLAVGDIATRSHIERTVVCRLLDRMEADGLIDRTPNESDRRVRDIRITAKGRQLYQRMRPVRDQVYARAIAGIEPAQLELACKVITKMTGNLGGGDVMRPFR